MRGVSRRDVLIGGIGAAALVGAGGAGYELVQDGTLPGKYQLDRLLGACGGDPGVPDVAAGPVTTTSFYSRYRSRTVAMVVMRPPGARGSLPAAIVLHGMGGDAQSAVSLGYPRFLAAAVAGGAAPFAAVSVDGGGSTYWHRRADGDDPLGMIVNEVLPRLRLAGYTISKIALIGWSMGGYGALLLASDLGPGRVRAVAASSPAVFGSYAAAAGANSGSFDSAADFAANDIASAGRLATLRRIPVRIDCGSNDPFSPEDTALRERLGHPPGAISAGCHDQAFWRRSLPAELAFVSRHLALAVVAVRDDQRAGRRCRGSAGSGTAPCRPYRPSALRTWVARSSSGTCTVFPVSRSVSSALPLARPRLPIVIR